MNDNTIIQISQTISKDIDLSKCQNQTLREIELSIEKINILLKNEKTREKLVKNELKINISTNKYNMVEYLNSIEKNIKKLTLFLEILYNKRKFFLFDAKNYFNSLQNINLEEKISRI